MSEIDALQAYLAAHPAPYAKQFEQVVQQVDEQAAKAQRGKTLAARKKAWIEAVREFDVEKLVELQTKMQGYVDKIARIDFDPEHPRALTDEERLSMGSEFVDFLEISEFLTTRRDLIKEMVFGHLDATVGENTNGEIPVPEVGRTLRREGCGRTTPGIDTEKLKGLLGDDWDRCLEVTEVPEQIIPAHTEVEFSEEKLMALCAEKPETLEALRQSLIPGQIKTPRFTNRAYKPQKENK